MTFHQWKSIGSLVGIMIRKWGQATERGIMDIQAITDMSSAGDTVMGGMAYIRAGNSLRLISNLSSSRCLQTGPRTATN